MNLLLEKFTAADFADYFRLVGDTQVMAMITERALPETEARTEFEQLLANNALHPDFGCFKVSDEQGRYLGLGKLALDAANSRQAELGYMLLPAYWGQGMAGEIARTLVAQARAQDLDGLFAIIDPANLASRKILLNNGFIHQEYKEFDGLPGEILSLNLRTAP
ncbi:RimJ/RimL family protein N-acetyltransferase [Neisseria sp. HSC-16F19]|nr:GNAT family N-acetyltransferase [Neisseria sp. HSC-16F19]MCP2040731.1 RimJ/RimL family protein N-acetyltransferase [Neisseria sp. HSC-16F19]